LPEAKSSRIGWRAVILWIGAILAVTGAAVLLSSYFIVPLNLGETPWNPMTWVWDFSHSYAYGWMAAIPLVIGIVIYASARAMKPKEE